MGTFFSLRTGLTSLLTLSLSVSAANLAAQPTTADWTAFNQAALKHHVVPRYQQLQQASTELMTSSSDLCQQPTDATFKQTQQAFQSTMDAWQGIQHIRSGPVELMMRGFSMQFWPDKKNHVGKQLEELLAEKDPNVITGDGVYSMSVAVRGLPAIERLLFDEDALTQLKQDPYRCDLLARISSYVAEMSTGMANEWQQDMPGAFAEAGQDEESLYSSQEEISVLLLKPIVESIEVAKDLKILRPLGSELSSAKVKRLESWRSQRSLRNIQLNLEAVTALYRGENGLEKPLRNLLSTEQQQLIDKQTATIYQQIADIQAPMEVAITTEKGYNALATLAEELEVLLKAYEAAIADSGLFLGFNSRDGD